MFFESNVNIEFVTSVMSTFGPLLLTAVIVYLCGTYGVIPLIRKFYLDVLIWLNGGKEPENAIIDVEILCKRAWAAGGVVMLLSLTKVSHLLADVSMEKGVLAFSVLGLAAGLRGYKELRKFKSIARIYKGDILRHKISGTSIMVKKVQDGLIIGETPRPNIRRGVFQITDYLDGNIEDLGPYGGGEMISFVADTTHKSYNIEKAIEWRKAVRKMLSERDDIILIMNGKYILPNIDFIISAQSCDSTERDIDIYSDVSVEIEHITKKLDLADFIKPVPRKS